LLSPSRHPTRWRNDGGRQACLQRLGG
jgi:hypothetical protein